MLYTRSGHDRLKSEARRVSPFVSDVQGKPSDINQSTGQSLISLSQHLQVCQARRDSFLYRQTAVVHRNNVSQIALIRSTSTTTKTITTIQERCAMATAPMPAAPILADTPRQSKTRHARKPIVENWDDDFEYAGPSKPKAPSTKSLKSENKLEAGRSSPTESIVSSWNDSPPPSTNLAALHTAAHARYLSKTLGGPHLGPPRHSPSHSPGLPPHLSKARHQSLAAPVSLVAPGMSRSRSGSTSAFAARKLSRHPSTSFLPSPHLGHSASSISLVGNPNRSSPNLPRSSSSERMPPPALPLHLDRRPSKGKPKIRSDGVRVSGIPFSPSQEALREAERRPSLWKRLSSKSTNEKKSTYPQY